jgi:hypothetical protein
VVDSVAVVSVVAVEDEIVVELATVAEHPTTVEVNVMAEHPTTVELSVVVELGVVVELSVVATLVNVGQMPLLERRALGYSTLGIPLERVTVSPPPESVVYAVQLITSTSAWLASKPVADDERVIVVEDEAPTLVNTPTTCDPEFPLRIATVWLSE